MNRKLIPWAVLCALGLSSVLTACNDSDDDVQVKSVEFVQTVAAPTDVAGMSVTQTVAKAVVSYDDGTTKDFALTYHTLFGVKDKVGGNAHPAGQAYDHQMQALMDPFGKPVVLETPDANSLLNVEGNLFLVTHLEYDWLLSDGAESWTAPSWYSRVPTGMLLSGLDQAADGKLSVKTQKPIDFSSVNGTWINCFGSQTSWNTHLGSEEDYDLQYNPLVGGYATTTNGVKAMTDLYWKNSRPANPYHYGWIPEVTVKKDGSTTVVKHYAMGRGTWEQAKLMADDRTAYLGDDGTHGLMAMFVADKAKDLSAGTIYAAKWNQTSAADGGKADLTWYKLGHATDAEIKTIIDSGVIFASIFDAVAPAAGTCAAGYTRVRVGSTADECLALKPGMERAAAFIETRRYAALLGATTEFTKMEGVAHNAKDKKVYMAMSAIRDSMTSMTGEPADHIKLTKVSSGATFTIDLAGAQKTANGAETIASDYVGTKMYVEAALLGRDIPVDARGNTADVDKVANTDNVFFSEKMRTLFIGEDSGMHVNNYVWAYNVDTKKLTRILSSTAGAENTGLQVVDDLNGKGAYIMSNNQHWGDLPGAVPADLKSQLAAKIDKFQAPVGYIGGLPSFK
jgi:secreted PhoX family phosphatase